MRGKAARWATAPYLSERTDAPDWEPLAARDKPFVELRTSPSRFEINGTSTIEKGTGQPTSIMYTQRGLVIFL